MPKSNSTEEEVVKQNQNRQELPFPSSNPAVVDSLSKGFLSKIEPHLVKAQQQLSELTSKESAIFNEIHNENLRIAEVLYSNDLQKLFRSMEVYQKKLANIKKDIKGLHEKSTKLKKRALKLQQIKEREEYLKQQKAI